MRNRRPGEVRRRPSPTPRRYDQSGERRTVRPERGPEALCDSDYPDRVENQVFNLAATRPDLLTGVNPATGQPTPYGSVGVDINCAVIGYTAQAPTANLAAPVPNSQFPPR
jgi:hypothetical protein